MATECHGQDCHRSVRLRSGVRIATACHTRKVVIAEFDCNEGFALPQSATGKTVIAEVGCDEEFAWPQCATGKVVVAKVDCDEEFAWPQSATGNVLIADLVWHTQGGDRGGGLR